MLYGFASLVAVSWAAASSWSLPAAGHRHHRAAGIVATFTETGSGAPSTEAAVAGAADSRLVALRDGLRREYESFFQPLLPELYNPSVSFADPLIALEGLEKYKSNVNMLAGETLLGKLCFTDCGLVMHNVTETAEGGLMTRWTLQFRFKLLPWRPLAQFTGVSVYTLDGQQRVLAQQDYWDSINLQPGGGYEAVPKAAALADFARQLAPRSSGAQQASDKELPYVLLRRGADYEVRRYPQHVAAQTKYYQRIDAFGTLGAYTNGANEQRAELTPYVPSLMSVPQDERTAEQVLDDSLDLKPSKAPKVMSWPMAVPAMREAAPPKPNERIDGVVGLALIPSRVVAVYGFSDPTTEPNVRGYHALLCQKLRADGIVPSEGEPTESFRLAQFDALNSFGARRSEVWVDLEEHPW